MTLISSLHYLLGEPPVSAGFRARCEDFVVEEVLGFEPDGRGEHCLLQIRKTDANTAYVARRIADICGIRERDVSYSGLKDRRAVATQWFSVHLPGKPDPAAGDIESDEIQVLRLARHSRKLRRGAHVGNRFVITLRELDGNRESVDQRLQAVADRGFPNYFGEQRFGRNGQNLDRARQMLSGKSGKKRKRDSKSGLYLSAARSALFNSVLSKRLKDGHYTRILAGDVMMLAGSRSVFSVEEVDDELQSRMLCGDIHITGPLWGGGDTLTSPERHAWEMSCLEDDAVLRDGLAAQKLKQERRSLRAIPKDMSWCWPDAATLQISFFLGSGSYATSLLREVAVLKTSCSD